MVLNQKTKNNNCLICGFNNYSPLYRGTLLQCNNCHFITANIIVDHELLKKIYTKNYFLGEEYLNYLEEKPFLQKNFKKNINKLIQKGLNLSNKNILEIGCSYGFFGEILNKMFSLCYTGIDVVTEACKHARKINPNSTIVCGDYLSQHFKKKFDHVFMWDVIEHLQYPDKFIKKIHQELNNEGKLFITTGDISAIIPRIQKHRWRLIHPPSHLHYFSKKTISQLLKNNGFIVNHISYPSVSRSLKQIFYSLFVLNKNTYSIVKSIYQKIPCALAIPINTYDIMLVDAQKK